jgi:hypothetical protein
MPTLANNLTIERCPHCNVDSPNMGQVAEFNTESSEAQNPRIWRCYACSRCGGVVTAAGQAHGNPITLMFPEARQVDDAIPERARSYLKQALQSSHAPAGAVMLASSSVDAMLKQKGYTDGSLNSRINKAAKDHLITKEMANWAHEVRLDANDQRHSDISAELPSDADALRSVEFAGALAQFLFVLPARVERGLQSAAEPEA